MWERALIGSINQRKWCCAVWYNPHGQSQAARCWLRLLGHCLGYYTTLRSRRAGAPPPGRANKRRNVQLATHSMFVRK